jgi:hypothetical protein
VKKELVIVKSPPLILTLTSTFSLGPIFSKLGVSAVISWPVTHIP